MKHDLVEKVETEAQEVTRTIKCYVQFNATFCGGVEVEIEVAEGETADEIREQLISAVHDKTSEELFDACETDLALYFDGFEYDEDEDN